MHKRLPDQFSGVICIVEHKGRKRSTKTSPVILLQSRRLNSGYRVVWRTAKKNRYKPAKELGRSRSITDVRLYMLLQCHLVLAHWASEAMSISMGFHLSPMTLLRFNVRRPQRTRWKLDSPSIATRENKAALSKKEDLWTYSKIITDRSLK